MPSRHLSATGCREIEPMSDSPARHLNLAGASNFRDLGGYATRDGSIVRWRQIFRSNHLGHLTEQDIVVMRELGVRSAFDFRGSAERVEAACCMPDISVHSLPVEPTVVAALRGIASSGTALSTDHAAEVMRACGVAQPASKPAAAKARERDLMRAGSMVFILLSGTR